MIHNHYKGRKRVYLKGYGFYMTKRGKATGKGFVDNLKRWGSMAVDVVRNNSQRALELAKQQAKDYIKNNPEVINKVKDQAIELGKKQIQNLGEKAVSTIQNKIGMQQPTVKTEIEHEETPKANVTSTQSPNREEARRKIYERMDLNQLPSKPSTPAIQAGYGTRKKGSGVKYVL